MLQVVYRGFAPGKVILLGEHAVVYGHPALAGPLRQGVTATGARALRPRLLLPAALRKEARRALQAAFDAAAKAAGSPGVVVRLASELPVSMGLGSSAAVSVAIARVLLAAAGRQAGTEAVCALAEQMERQFHGTPSGIDHTCAARSELIAFQRDGKRRRVRAVRSPRPLGVVVALAGERPSTRQTVAALRMRQARWKARYRRLLGEIGEVAREGTRAVERGDLDGLGDAMNVNHGLLVALGLSSRAIDEQVHALRQLGALGAKLTGAGGDGGAVVGLFEEPRRAVARLRRRGVACFESALTGPEPLGLSASPCELPAVEERDHQDRQRDRPDERTEVHRQREHPHPR